MDKKEILKSFIEDPLLKQKYGLSEKEINSINFHEKSRIKIVEIIKEMILQDEDKYTEDVIVRRINKYLNI